MLDVKGHAVRYEQSTVLTGTACASYDKLPVHFLRNMRYRIVCSGDTEPSPARRRGHSRGLASGEPRYTLCIDDHKMLGFRDELFEPSLLARVIVLRCFFPAVSLGAAAWPPRIPSVLAKSFIFIGLVPRLVSSAALTSLHFHYTTGGTGFKPDVLHQRLKGMNQLLTRESNRDRFGPCRERPHSLWTTVHFELTSWKALEAG